MLTAVLLGTLSSCQKWGVSKWARPHLSILRFPIPPSLGERDHVGLLRRGGTHTKASWTNLHMYVCMQYCVCVCVHVCVYVCVCVAFLFSLYTIPKVMVKILFDYDDIQ